MKKFIAFTLTQFLIAGQLFADVPSLPRDETGKVIPFTKYEELNESQKKEFGAFMLFYELVSSKKIGGDTGLCLDYKGGGDDHPDKISIGLDSKSYPTGVASLDSIDKNKLENLQELLKQIGQYLDSGCDGDLNRCKESRSVKITGFADAQHYGGKGIRAAKNEKDKAALIEKSIQENINLSKNRAQLFSGLVNTAGFVNQNKIRVEGKVSPVGEYLQNGIQVPEKYISADQSAKTLTKDNYAIDCPERRLTVIDVVFNSQASEINSKGGVVTPVLKSASKNFVQRSNQSIGIQSFKALEELKQEGKLRDYRSDEDVNKIIEKIVSNAGVKNPDILAACKSHATRTVVREHLKKIDKLSPASKSSLTSKSELDLLKIADRIGRSSDQDYELNSHLRTLRNGFAGLVELQNDHLLSSGTGNSGQSTSFNDCFSASSAMQMEFNDANKTAGVENNKLCQPIEVSANGEVNIKFDPHQLHDHSVLHIGCQACKTGFRYVPEKYKNPESGKEETQMVPVYIDREMNNGMSLPNREKSDLYSKRPIGVQEANDLVASFNSFKSKAGSEYNKAMTDHAKINTIKDMTEKRLHLAKKNLYTQMRGFTSNLSISSDYGFCLDMSVTGTCPVEKRFQLFKDSDLDKRKEFLALSGMTDEELNTIQDVFRITKTKDFGDTQKEYLEAKLKGQDNSRIVQRYEQVILKGIEARDVMTNWMGGSETADNAVLFGSLKKPRFYLLDDCDCSSENLIEQAQAKGKSVSIDRLPSEAKKHKVSKNSCIVSMPVPPSCMVDPNEKGVQDNGKKPQQSIKWMGLNGELMDKALSDMMNHLGQENRKVSIAGCEGLSPMAVAEKIVESAQCSGDMQLPQGEGLDCKK